MMTVETIDHNVECFKKQMSRFIDFSDDKALIVNNGDWLRDLNFLEFMRDVGAHFNVNEMLRARAYVNRMEKGLSFLEFSYMLMQSYDFYRLYHDYGCQMQFGGDDQWSNMLGGINLIRKKDGKDAYAMTINLLLKHDGTKMGKTAGGAVWLDPDKYKPYDFYQYWRNVDDADVLKFLRMMTFLPLEQIDEMDKWQGEQLNEAKRILAYELTSMVHGEDEAKKAEAGAKAVFMDSGNLDNVPPVEVTDDEFNENGAIDIVTVLVKSGQCQSRSDARRAITKDHSITVGDTKIDDFKYEIKKEDIPAEGLLVKKGKKNIKRIVRA
jgi:tyrosyl-tRNA synthetase